MSISAVISSLCALSRCTWAAGGTMSQTRWPIREPSSLTSSIRRSPSRLTILPSARRGEVRRGARGSSALGRRWAREAHPQLAILDGGARGVALGEHAGQRDLAAVVSDRHVQLPVVAAQVEARPIHEWHFEAEHVIVSVLVDALWARGREALGGILVSVSRSCHPLQHLDSDHLAVEQRHVEDRDACK